MAHPAISLTIVAGELIYVILALMLSKKATILIGLSDRWFAKRRRAMLIGWGMVLASLVMIGCEVARRATPSSVAGTGTNEFVGRGFRWHGDVLAGCAG